MLKRKNIILLIVVLIIFISAGLVYLIKFNNLIKIEKPDKKTTEIFKVNLPVKNLWADSFLDGGTIGVILLDSRGKEEFSFSFDGRLETARDGQLRYFYVGADHPEREGAKIIPYGGEEEKELLEILESWDSVRYKNDYSKPLIEILIKELKERVSLPEEFEKDVFNSGGWKIYRNENYGFEFKYPSEIYGLADPIEEMWISEGDRCLSGGFYYKFDYLNMFSILACQSENKTIKQWILENEADYYVDNIEKVIDSAENIMVDGREGIKIIKPPYSSGYGDTLLLRAYFSNNSRIYYLSVSNTELTEEKENLFNQILSTFRFLD